MRTLLLCYHSLAACAPITIILLLALFIILVYTYNYNRFLLSAEETYPIALHSTLLQSRHSQLIAGS